MRRIVVCVGVAIACVLGMVPADAATREVAIGDDFFSPSPTSINRGGTVHWVNEGGSPHTVTGAAPLDLFDSGSLSTGEDFSYDFIAAGTYDYFCDFHSGMDGRVKVPMAADPTSGERGTTFVLRIASEPAPEGFRYQIQRKAPSGDYVLWRTSFSRNVRFTTTESTPPGTYRFRTRLSEIGGGTSGYSSAIAVVVS